MREIEFRGYDGTDWIYGSAVLYDEETDTWYMIEHGSVDDDWIMVGHVGQFTGLKDESDDQQEIFDGDILQYEYLEDSCWGKAGTYIGHVRFDQGCFEVVHNRDSIMHYPDGGWSELSKYDDIKSLMGWAEYIKVIGNLYENPELLESK